jgi:maleylpyruvate isomerase
MPWERISRDNRKVKRMNEVSHSLDRLAAASERLVASAATLSDAQARAPSLLPGWTRGHVLTHVARNADGLRNLLIWARTGTETPMYASAESRSADIEAGAGRPTTALAADVRESAAAFAAEAASLPRDAWTVPVRALNGPPFPARGVLERRLSEVEIHHVDLAASYGPTDWPDEFLLEALPRVAESFAGRQDTPHCLIRPDGSTSSLSIGSAQPGIPTATVQGQPVDLLAWLLGRGDGTALTVAAGGTLPELPPWR